MESFLGFIPFAAFLGVFLYTDHDLLIATGALMIGSVVEIAGLKVFKKPIKSSKYWLAGLILSLGALTLFLRDPWIIKLKPSLVFFCLSIILFWQWKFKNSKHIKGWLQGLEAASTELGYHYNPQTIAIGGVFCCLVLSVANLVVAFNFSDEIWVSFKLFGLPIASIVMVAFLLYLSASKAKASTESESSDQTSKTTS